MSDEDNQQENTGVIAVVAIAVLIAIATVLFMGVGAVRKNAALGLATCDAVCEEAAAAVSAPASMTNAVNGDDAAPVGNEAAVRVVDGVVRFYFASGKADVAEGAREALAEAIAAAKEGKTLTISGFHDNTGSAELNAELAKQRAFSVRDLLIAEGVAEEAIELKKPEALESTKQGSDPEARRVDVVINR